MDLQLYDALMALAEKTIKKVCCCEPVAAGSNVEWYTYGPLHSPGLIDYDSGLGSIVERTFARAQTGARTAVMVDDGRIDWSTPLSCEKEDKADEAP